MLEEGPLRTAGETREYALEFQGAVAIHTGKNKLSSARWFNCERLPLDYNLPNECTILSVYAPEV